ncbi:MAG: cupin domain-containing protein [Deltaproteobacteria bacterium]|nr:cupin domain-containing protein [Deltaproteobacteria bacterium]
MKTYSLQSTELKPISHNPEILKKVLLDEQLSCLRHLSHTVLVPGNTAASHSHVNSFEIFYCVRGHTVFNVDGKDIAVKDGSCLVVEPGEDHAIVYVVEETELVYMLVFK